MINFGILFVVVLLSFSIGWFLHRLLLISKLARLQEKHSLVERDLDTITQRCKRLDAEHRRFKDKSSTFIKTLNKKKAALEQHCQRLETSNKELAGKNADIVQKITQLYQTKQLEISELNSAINLAKSRGELATSSSQELHLLKQTIERLEGLLISESINYQEHISELEKQLCQIQPLVATPEPTVTKQDDLTEISGIGPRLSEFLREFGIDSFHQLANMSDEELARLSNELGDIGDRIVRDKWVEQAQILCGNYG